MSSKCQYPNDIYSAFSQGKTFTVAGFLLAANAKDGDSPLKIYKKTGLNRFVFTIIDKGAGKGFGEANISLPEVPGLIEASRAAMQAETMLGTSYTAQSFALLKELRQQGINLMGALQNLFYFMKNGRLKPKQAQEPALPANIGEKAKNTKVLVNKQWKTAYDVLLEDPEKGRADLENQRGFLERNLAQHPGNQKQIDAIDEGLLMLSKGLIGNGEKRAASGPETMQKGDIVLCSPTPKAKIRKSDGDGGYANGGIALGICPVYELGIIWRLGDTYPVKICITSYKAPVTKKEDGRINPQCSQKTDVEQRSFSLSAAQWFDCLYHMEAHMRRFEILTAAKQFKDADDASYANWMESQQKNATPMQSA